MTSRQRADPSPKDDDFAHNGFGLYPGLFSPREMEELATALGPISGPGRRNLLEVPAVASLASSQRILDLIQLHLKVKPGPVRAIYFNKSSEANWMVPWHQDLTIAVRQRANVPGFGQWSIKQGVPHVQPPTEILEHMLTVRLHLDDTDETNGALRVLPGSHGFGKIADARIEELVREQKEFMCRLNVGDALLMRPLLLHASGRSEGPVQRRVLHIEFAGCNLPPPLEWAEA